MGHPRGHMRLHRPTNQPLDLGSKSPTESLDPHAELDSTLRKWQIHTGRLDSHADPTTPPTKLMHVSDTGRPVIFTGTSGETWGGKLD